ncbi:bacteriohemerythrin [Desulfogranum mediterraneum]|uniref:bacteriohemerythrin n=1 Tax=Desulfogranum mediterraneum TaxID=160661 RepID=UPI001377C9D2|nr:bacteriohemerythrin [Desulfogranum mediterraneum]
MIKWRTGYNTGVEEFDLEHQKIVQLLNEMFRVVRDKLDPAKVEDVIEALIAYSQKHFAAEERAMAEACCPELDEHRREHGKLIQSVSAYRQRLEAGDQKVAGELYLFLREWLLHHIMETDRKYAAYLLPGKEES